MGRRTRLANCDLAQSAHRQDDFEVAISAADNAWCHKFILWGGGPLIKPEKPP
jgi:hypothetical protein